jgi:DNA invertase Pin-like site-specific DNA recombinase
MLRRHFDPHRPHRYVCYGRMSSEMQNPHSPEQQFDNIEMTRRNLGYSWNHVKNYRDDAISGRYVGKRPGFQRMLDDLRSGRVKANLILVDTFERFGRAEEIASIRQELQTRYKILVLTADSNFTDPTSTAGRALAMIENIRSTEDGRIKAHNVLRGKRDLASRKRWPGAPVPLGFRLQSILVERDGRQEVEGHILVPDSATRMVPTRIFALALETGFGSRRIARALNADPSIPPEVKPISDEQIRLCLGNTLYMGVLTYGRHCTGIVDDRVIRERVDPGEELIVEGFCEPLVSREDFAAANELIRARREAQTSKSRRADNAGVAGADEVMPESRKYLLTGLMRCGDCGSAMFLSSHTVSKNEVDKIYTYYKCRKHASGQCGNKAGVREELLRELVVAKLRWRLFPPPEDPGVAPFWLAPLTKEIREEIEARTRGQGDPRPALAEEFKRLDGQTRGWSMSLGNAELSSSSRTTLEGLLAEALERRVEVERQLGELEATHAQLDVVLDEEAVVDRLRQLEVVLAAGNVAAGNRELRRVIERVACHSDGRLELRTHRQGLFEGVTAWLAPAATKVGRRGLGLGPGENDKSMYWTDPIEYAKPERAVHRSWARDHAAEVLAKQEETHWNVKRLADHFGKCRETIDRALEFAKESSPTSEG